MWPREDDRAHGVTFADQQTSNKYLPPKADIGKPKTRNYVIQQNNRNLERGEDERVIQALRGVPFKMLAFQLTPTKFKF